MPAFLGNCFTAAWDKQHVGVPQPAGVRIPRGLCPKGRTGHQRSARGVHMLEGGPLDWITLTTSGNAWGAVG